MTTKYFFILFAIVVSGWCGTPSWAVTADQDFAARCAAAGVVKCVGFDNITTDIVRGVNLSPDAFGVYRGGLDTTTKASGLGSLGFTLPPPPHAGANIAGQWTGANYKPVFGRTFSEHSTFYVQYRVRFSPEMFSNSWSSTWKVAVMHYSDQSCANLEWTIGRYYGSGMVAPYTHCGGKGPLTDTVTGKWQDPKLRVPPYFNMQQGDYVCNYTDAGKNPVKCFTMTPNQWITFYYEFHLGTWGLRNSQVKMFVQEENHPGYKKVIDVPDYAFDCNTNPCSQSPGKQQGFNTIKFTPYMTGLPRTSGKVGVTSHVWYDELIVSTLPIAAPSAHE